MTQGLEQVRRMAQDCGSDLALVVNQSGGKDSTRMLGFVRKKFPETPTYAVMADTGFEHVFPISAADFAFLSTTRDGTAGGYLRRFSCRVCIFSTDADLVAIHQHDRDAFDAVTSLERKLKFTMRPGASLVEIVEAHTSKHAEEARQQSFCF